MDDLDGRLRSRLATLAQAVPVAADTAPTERGPRPATRSRVSGVSALATMAVAVLVVGLAVAVAGQGGPPAAGSLAPLPATSPAASESSSASTSPTTGVPATPLATPSTEPTRPPSDVALPYPDGCPAYGLSPRRCAYIVDWALEQAGVPADQARVLLLGDPECEGKPAGCMSPLRTTTFVVRVRVLPASGEPSDHPVFCGLGGDASMLCSDTPVIRISTPITGYHDVPCGPVPGGEPGASCATPLPTIAPSAAEQAVPLRVPRLTIAIDHAGSYAVDLGDAVLPNGILSETTATLADDRRSDVLIPQGIQLQVLGPDGKPLDNAYAQGWRSGTETVHVRLVFTVESFDPGATLEITDVVVR